MMSGKSISSWHRHPKVALEAPKEAVEAAATKTLTVPRQNAVKDWKSDARLACGLNKHHTPCSPKAYHHCRKVLQATT